MPPMPISPWAQGITSSEVCRDIRSCFSASLESTATRKQGSNSSRSPPSAAIISGRLRKFCWRWRPCARNSQKSPANNLRSSSRNSPRTRFLLVSWPNSMFLLPRLSPRMGVSLAITSAPSLLAVGIPGLRHPERCIRSSRTHFRALGFEVLLVHHPSPLRPAKVNGGERMKEPRDVQQPQHHGYDNHGVQD